jgi:hypothetical protein
MSRKLRSGEGGKFATPDSAVVEMLLEKLDGGKGVTET